MEKVTRKMTFGELLEKYPETGEILLKNGLHCIGCAIGTYESIEDGCTAHGISDEDIDKMIEEINELVKKSDKKEE